MNKESFMQPCTGTLFKDEITKIDAPFKAQTRKIAPFSRKHKN